jgi:hypothetical protein
MSTITQRGLLLAALLALLLLSGCGPSAGALSGKVTYRGKELSTGSVLLLGSDGIPQTAPIGPDGSFRFDNVPPGPARFGVSSPSPAAQQRQIVTRAKTSADRPRPAPASAAVRSPWFPIPAKFAMPETSGLACTVTGHGDTHHIVLTD